MKYKILFFALGVILLMSMYCFLYVHYEVTITPKVTAMICDLGDLRGALIEYYNDKRSWPQTLENLGLDYSIPKDAVSGKSFLYTPSTSKCDESVLVSQPESFRTKLWPFGEMRRYVLLANGAIHDVSASY